MSPQFTEPARGALRNAGFSRRDFLKSSGVMVVGFTAGGRLAAQGPTAGSPPMNQLDSWIAIAADGRVTAYTGKEELGQGISTAQTQLVAEELSVPFERVKLIYCDTALTPDQAHTSGSQSHPANFNRANLALAAATAYQSLLKMASDQLKVPPNQLDASNGVITAKTDTAKRVTYGQLIGGKKFSLVLDPTIKRKDPREWTVLGQPIASSDLPALVTGRFEFVHNVRVPGMLHGRVVRPPTAGATLMSVDESSVKDMPGFVKVVVRKNFVGVVAQKPWQAMQAASKLRIAWQSPSAPLPTASNFYDSLRQTGSRRDTLLVDAADFGDKMRNAATTIKATYMHPYQMHGSLASSCAVADVQGEKATLWSATQGVWYQKNTAAAIIGLKPENVRVIFARGSGCYGCNGADAVTYDAAILSQAVGKPVRVQLSRKDEMAWENYGNAFLMDQTVGLDAQGNIVAWEHESWSPGKGGRPGPARPGNVITGSLVGFEPAPFTPRSPAPAAQFNNNSNGVPSYLAVPEKGANRGTGSIAAGRVLLHALPSAFFTGPLRSPARLQNTFAHESFMDEIAAKVKVDPVEFRLRHLKDQRLIDVLKAAAKAANWETRPPAPPSNSNISRGRGVACVLYEGDNGYTAMVVEVEVHRPTGQITVRRIVSANDVGPVSNPMGLRNQVEGGALQGLSRALGEEVTWDLEKITSVDWRTYHSLPVGFDLPKIETVILNRQEEEATGAGETSITLIAAALGNAIFDATGARLRQIPFTPERVKAAIAARA